MVTVLAGARGEIYPFKAPEGEHRNDAERAWIIFVPKIPQRLLAVRRSGNEIVVELRVIKRVRQV